MKNFLGKIGFIHRRLWEREALYRTALLFGPVPLLGCMLAAALWESVVALGGMTTHQPPWAVPQHAEVWNTDADGPQTVRPAKPIPLIGANGALTGYEAGWRVAASTIQVISALDVDLKPDALATFFLEGSSIDMAQILAKGPSASLYVGVGSGFLVVRTAGIYTLSAQLERPAAPVADCLVRLGFGPRRVVSNLEVSITGDISEIFPGARFDLQPGLYPIGWAFGCWHDGKVIGPGRMTLLVGGSSDQDLQPARSEDVVRPKPTSP